MPDEPSRQGNPGSGGTDPTLPDESRVSNTHLVRIETERLILRRWYPDDIDALESLQSDPLVAPWLGFPTRVAVERAIDRYEQSWES